MSRSFGVNIMFETPEGTHCVQYIAEMVYAGVYLEKFDIYKLNKHSLIVNQYQIDDHAIGLADACTQKIYPIHIFCDDGKFSGVQNDDVVKRWNGEKHDLLRRYEGMAAQNYINDVEKVLYSDKLQDWIQTDLFWNALLGIQYKVLLERPVTLNAAIPLIPFKKPLDASIQQKVLATPQGYSLCQEGVFCDPRKLSDLFPEQGFEQDEVQGTVLATFEFDQQQLLDSLHCQYLLNHQEQCLLKVGIQAYYLPERPLVPVINTQLQQQSEDEIYNNLSFWDKVLDFFFNKNKKHERKTFSSSGCHCVLR